MADERGWHRRQRPWARGCCTEYTPCIGYVCSAHADTDTQVCNVCMYLYYTSTEYGYTSCVLRTAYLACGSPDTDKRPRKRGSRLDRMEWSQQLHPITTVPLPDPGDFPAVTALTLDMGEPTITELASTKQNSSSQLFALRIFLRGSACLPHLRKRLSARSKDREKTMYRCTPAHLYICTDMQQNDSPTSQRLKPFEFRNKGLVRLVEIGRDPPFLFLIPTQLEICLCEAGSDPSRKAPVTCTYMSQNIRWDRC